MSWMVPRLGNSWSFSVCQWAIYLPFGWWCGFEDECEFGGGDASALGVDFVADAGDGFAFEVREFFAVLSLLGFVVSHERDDDGDESGFGHRFAVGACFVFIDANPGGLSLS